MKFTSRREYLYDPEVFKRQDVAVALKIHDEYIRRHAGKPYTRFLEVDRSSAAIDPLWHQPSGGIVQYSRNLEVPCIAQFEKLNWAAVRTGRAAQQRVKYWTSNLILQALDYFPAPGDCILWNGYRTQITSVEFEPASFWQQTNVWLGIVYIGEIVPQGDLRPLANPGELAAPELAPDYTGKEQLNKGTIAGPTYPAPPSGVHGTAYGPDLSHIK